MAAPAARRGEHKDIVATIEGLLARGRAAFAAHLDRLYTPTTRPIGTESLACVTLEDFTKHPDLCASFAAMQRSVFVLARDGSPMLLLCRHSLQTAPPGEVP